MGDRGLALPNASWVRVSGQTRLLPSLPTLSFDVEADHELANAHHEGV